MPRLFTGIEVPETVADALSSLRGGLPGARWIDPADYHVTLRFLGDIDNRTARDVAETLDGVGRESFDLGLESLGAFGGDRPRAIYAAVTPHRSLTELQEERERVARSAGLPPEPRKFTPHVTLARLRNVSSHAVAEYLALQGRFPVQRFSVSSFVLYSSRASAGGGPYIIEQDYPLGWGEDEEHEEG